MTQAPTGLRAFFIIWVGQVVSTIGSSLTGFVLGVWVYQQTGSATQFALIAACAAGKNLVDEASARSAVTETNHDIQPATP